MDHSALLSAAMRKYLGRPLREWFEYCWTFLPASDRDLLSAVVSVREKHIPGGSGYCSTNDRRVHILLDPSLAGDRENAILTILHELAHARDYLNDDWVADRRVKHVSEAAAWWTAGAWLLTKSETSEESIRMALEAIRRGQDLMPAGPPIANNDSIIQGGLKVAAAALEKRRDTKLRGKANENC